MCFVVPSARPAAAARHAACQLYCYRPRLPPEALPPPGLRRPEPPPRRPRPLRNTTRRGRGASARCLSRHNSSDEAGDVRVGSRSLMLRAPSRPTTQRHDPKDHQIDGYLEAQACQVLEMSFFRGDCISSPRLIFVNIEFKSGALFILFIFVSLHYLFISLKCHKVSFCNFSFGFEKEIFGFVALSLSHELVRPNVVGKSLELCGFKSSLCYYI